MAGASAESETGSSTFFEEARSLPRQEQQQAAEHVVRHYISRTRYSNAVNSGIVGYFDGDPLWQALQLHARSPRPLHNVHPQDQWIRGIVAEG